VLLHHASNSFVLEVMSLRLKSQTCYGPCNFGWVGNCITLSQHARHRQGLNHLLCVILSPFLQESLRVRPPVGLLARWGPEGTTLAGYDISSKVLLVSPYVQHMDTQVIAGLQL
jgi:hypothetical protein